MAEKDMSSRLRRAVKENNLFIVKRLLERTNDMRNADPVAPRYTSLAWAAVLGNEDTFEYLLEKGHDDDELSKDAENNTILIILSGIRKGVNSPYSSSRGPDSLQEAALRMGRSYLERYPFVLDWSNAQGETALHRAATKGNEEFVSMLCDSGADVDLADLKGNTPLHYASSWGHLPVIKMLIEKGCQFAARNNEGFTATDYAYSNHTKETLENAARAIHDARKNARRPPYAQIRAMSLDEERPLPPKKNFKKPPARLRSGSGTTTTSDSADEIAVHLNSQSSLSSITSSQPSGLSSQSSLPISSSSPSMRNHPHNGSITGTDGIRLGQTPTPNNGLGLPSSTHPALSPIASRVLANDAGAMAEYLKRSRSGSQGESNRHVVVHASSPHPPSSISNSSTPPIMEEPISQKYSLRRLRPSLSAAALRQTAASSSQNSPGGSTESRSRIRAGTNPTPVLRPHFSPPTPPSRISSEDSGERFPQTPRRVVTSGPPLPSLPEPLSGSERNTPPALPPKDIHFTHRRGPSVS